MIETFSNGSGLSRDNNNNSHSENSESDERAQESGREYVMIDDTENNPKKVPPGNAVTGF